MQCVHIPLMECVHIPQMQCVHIPQMQCVHILLHVLLDLTFLALTGRDILLIILPLILKVM
jgi:hypothetical protein